ncbi:MAG: hypothetical protein ACYC35_18105 [Pirellulales bacterium]
MSKDEIIAEVWRNRDEYVRAHHHDLDEIVADLQRREETHPEKVIDRRTKRTAPSPRRD